MKSIIDVRELLKKFGIIIYIGDRIADLELMESEIKELYTSQLIDQKEFEMAIFLLRQEIQQEKERKQKLH